MNYSGLILGVATFLLIGVFHVIVVKGEYYFSKKIWPLFLATGIASLFISLFISSPVISSLIAVFGISCLWSIRELFEQEDRVKKGWFPKNPKRRY
ncbi:DUF4491 family protein [Catonella massiliensis]|uniref:DUF4491 family protein n=1 Tax=Catonella massiliensis TaxID=2799636 RepID=A0ABS1IX29_9FIRM|nr:DUF4491 family protein [Catonella massiliensis]MBK5896451.1 DUF4491 family protein [Catonella massiliensis]